MKVVIIIIAISILFPAGSLPATDTLRSDREILSDTYLRNRSRLAASSFGMPLFLDSSELKERVHVDVYGIFDYPFSSIVTALKVPANWCEIVALHPNVKACTYRERSGDWLLTFYLGRKYYQPPEEADPVVYRYQNVIRREGYLDIILIANAGPFGTEDHRMRFEALPLAGGKTFVHVSYSYSDTVALRLAQKVYFATLGRSKVGFTVIGTDGNDNPVLIGGPRGALERNAVRYYLAIRTFMETSRYPEESRFSMRLSQWYDLTSHYRKQLFDLDKNEYLTGKTSERKNQTALQHSVGN